MKFAAYVMAGGGSRRFGTDKARATHEGLTLVERNVAILAERYGACTVVSAPGRSYDDLGLSTIHDTYADQGPLAGLHAAMVHCESDAIAIAACDLVGLQADWYEALEREVADGAAVYRNERWHPLVGVYSVKLLPEIEERLRTGRLAARELLDEFGVGIEPPPEFASLVSVDRPESMP